MSRPSGLWMPPVESLTATTVEPSSRISRAAIEPALPKPWTATVAVVEVDAQVRGGLDDAVDGAAGGRLVAALRAAEAIGLPVTTPGTVYPTCIEYVSMIQAIVWAFVLTSGAGMSLSGPMRMLISVA